MKTIKQSPSCQSCGEPFKGTYCYQCGEKQLTENDFSVRAFLAHAVDIFTHFDGKFFNSFRFLLTSPGRLTLEFLNGRRVRYMKPLQLYLVVGLAFFFFLKDWDIFYGRLKYIILQPSDESSRLYEPGELKGYELWLKNKVAAKAEAQQVSFPEMITRIDNKLPDTSKALAFLMIPWLGLSLYLVGFRQYRQYVPHLVHATHIFCFLLATALIWVGGYTILLRAFPIKMNLGIALGPVTLIFFIYLFISMRKVMPGGILVSTLKFLVVTILGVFGMMALYREFMTLVAIYFL